MTNKNNAVLKQGGHSPKSLWGIFRVRNARGVKQAKGHEEYPRQQPSGMTTDLNPLPPRGGRGPVRADEGAKRFTARSVIPQACNAGYSGRSGFTLIELLVVVLIIGILAAIAVPQYQIAVGKARMIEGITLCNSLAKAQQIYFLANGDYSHSLADIDIEMPTGGTMNTQKNRIEYPHFTLTMEGEKNNDWYCGVVSKTSNIMYYHYWRPSAFFFQTDCRAPIEDKISTSICKNLGGKYKGSWNGSDGKQWRTYVILENK